MRKAAVFFDVDGTLCDTSQVHALAFAKTIAELRIAAPKFDYSLFSGMQTEEVFRNLIHKNHEELIADASKLKRDFFKASVDLVRPMQYAIETLNLLYAQGIKMYAVSSGSTSSVMETLSSCRMLTYFEEIITCDSVQQTKPGPEPYLRAIDLSNFDVGACIAVEDSEVGVKSALAAQLETFLISQTMPIWATQYPVQHLGSLKLLKRIFDGSQ